MPTALTRLSIDTLTGETGPPTITLTLDDQPPGDRNKTQDKNVLGPDLQDLTMYLNINTYNQQRI